MPQQERSKRATRRDVAKAAGVAESTVSFVLNGTKYVSPEIKARVYRAIEKLGYRPNLIARSLTSAKTRQLGLIIPNLDNPYYSGLTSGVQDVAMGRGHIVILALAAEETFKDIMSAFIDRNVDAIVLDAGGHIHGQADLLRNIDIPVVTCDYQLSDIPWVLPDHRAGTAAAIEHLTALGHRSIGLLAGHDEESERLTGWLDSLRDLGLSPTAKVIGDYNYEAGYSAGERFVEAGVTAVLAANDFMAVGLLDFLLDAGLRVPDDISVIGYDDIWLSRHTRPSLTTVRVLPKEVGKVAAELALDMADGGEARNTRVPVELVVRESTGSIPKC